MKKLLTLALAVLGFATAQALTFGWSNYGTPIAHNTEGVKYDLSLGRVTYTADNINYSVNNSNTGFTSGDYAIKSLAFAIWSGGAWNNDDARDVALAIIQGSTITALSTSTERLWVYNGGTASSNTAYPGTGDKGYIHFNFNNMVEVEKDETFSIIFVEGDTSTDIIGSAYDSTADYIYSVANTNPQIVGNNNVIAFRTSVESVPEPTVLALLALGVAGVALRRKKVVA